jgi:hypothetical protein
VRCATLRRAALHFMRCAALRCAALYALRCAALQFYALHFNALLCFVRSCVELVSFTSPCFVVF